MRIIALRLLTKLALVFLLVLPFTIPAEAHQGFRGGGRVIIVPRYSYSYPYWGGGDWGGGWGPYWDYGPYYHENKGKIKIRDHNKLDQVYINDAYAGTVEKMRTIKLDPGHYSVQIRRDGKELLNRSVYVVVDKTVEIDLDGS